MNRFFLTSFVVLGLSSAASAQAPANATATPVTTVAALAPAKTAAAPAPASATAATPAPEETPAAAPVTPAPADVTPATPAPPVSIAAAAAAAAAEAPAPEQEPARAVLPTPFPAVTFGVVSFLQFAAELHESDGYNAFDVTRGYLNINARLSDRVRVRFTPDVRPTTDADLERNLALRLEYASLDVQVSDNVGVMFGLHEMPWLTFEETLNRYRVLGPFFAERLGLIPGATDLGASIRATYGYADIHVGVYNGEGNGRAEIDKYKSIDGRATVRPFSEESELGKVSISGFYQYGWYARDRPRNVAIGMGSYESDHVVATAQYLQATDNPFVAVDVERRGFSFFGEGRQGPTGWAAIYGLDLFDPDANNDGDNRRRTVFGGAHWSELGRGKLGVVASLEQEYSTTNSQLLERRLLLQTHIEF